jgi:hypothetical protein
MSYGGSVAGDCGDGRGGGGGGGGVGGVGGWFIQSTHRDEEEKRVWPSLQRPVHIPSTAGGTWRFGNFDT